MKTPASLAQAIKKGNAKALAKGISLLEDGDPGSYQLLDKVSTKKKKAVRIGITGLPGSGKSTLIERTAERWLKQGHKVGVILVDPTSPITSGALLGDRIRLKKIQNHKNIFIRSMATRGRLGGLALAARYAADLMEAAGYKRILIETVGVGQLEVEVASAAHLVLVVLVPGMGDEIQILKAGLMEIANCFILNKMDLDKDRVYYALFKKTLNASYESQLEVRRQKPPTFPVSTLTREGIEKFLKELEDMVKAAKNKPLSENIAGEVRLLVEQKLSAEILDRNHFEREVLRHEKKAKSPFKIAEIILKGFKRNN